MASEATCVTEAQVAAVYKPLGQFFRRVMAWRKRHGVAVTKDRETSLTAATLEVSVGNTCRRLEKGDGGSVFEWVAHVTPTDESQKLIRAVNFHLHPTFPVQDVRVEKAPFAIRRRVWGTFGILITVEDIYGGTRNITHSLNFDKDATNKVVKLRVAVPARDASAAAGTPVDASAAAGTPVDASDAAGTPVDASDTAGTPVDASSAEHSGKVEEGDDDADAGESDGSKKRMTGVPAKEMHGRLYRPEWKAPLQVTYCNEAARPGYDSMKAHEYNDDMETLHAKVRTLARLIRKAKHCVAYTGAGISTASGINDYASKAKDSVATGSRAERAKRASPLDALPTFSHYALTALHRAGLMKHWVQQNHDGLPQKAGYPQQHLNEIHGAWFDPSNPVVPMSGTLRRDLCEWMVEEEKAADLVLAMGTSMCGMNADRMVMSPSRRAAHGKALGSVIIGLQRTRLDHVCSLRFYAKIDEVMLLLALELGLPVPTTPYVMSIPDEARVEGHPHTFMVPYDAQGYHTPGRTRKWKLVPKSKIRVTVGPGKDFKGRVFAVSPDGMQPYIVALPDQREGSRTHGKGVVTYALGPWMVEAACRGHLSRLPFVNCYF